MRGTVKFFDTRKGWGFITDSDGKDIFVHHKSIIMSNFRSLNQDDIVDFELGVGKNGKEQAVNVTPVITIRMIKNALKEKKQFLRIKDTLDLDLDRYIVVDENNVIQSSEHGMTFLKLAAYAGFDTEGLKR